MNQLAFAIAKTILNRFDRHFDLFQKVTRQAKHRFEHGLWQEVQVASRERTLYYDLRVGEAEKQLKNEFGSSELDAELWRDVKQHYLKLIQDDPRTELAESFYNSVFCHIFHRRYYNNDHIFVETNVQLEDIKPIHPIVRHYDLREQPIAQVLAQVVDDYQFSLPLEEKSDNLQALLTSFRDATNHMTENTKQAHLEMLSSVFYRNKGAYLIGRVVTEHSVYPIAVALVNAGDQAIRVDALLTTEDELALIFGFARAYFFVETQHPAALVSFLKKLIPRKTYAELYNAIGFHKQGKTQFYRDFLHHLKDTDDRLEVAPGIRGMVMAVFHLPSYPYVFKIIKDKFAPQKNFTRKVVKEKYQLVKLHDRVGRMADTMEYSDVALPRSRFAPELLEELMEVARSSLYFEGDLVVIRHCYIERRMTPLNIYLDQALKEGDEEKLHNGLYGYGQAIKELAAANIFPGDMLLKNFGVSRHGRVIFYDYDEISYMTEVNFRKKPKAMYWEDELSAEPFYSVAPEDVFPEEFETFVLTRPEYRDIFSHYHADLLTAEYWQSQQAFIRAGKFLNVYPYPENKRLEQHLE